MVRNATIVGLLLLVLFASSGCCNARVEPRYRCTCDATRRSDGEPTTYTESACSYSITRAVEKAESNCGRVESEFENCTNCVCERIDGSECRSACTTHDTPES